MWKPPCPRCDQQSGSCVETHLVDRRGWAVETLPAVPVHRAAVGLYRCLTALGHDELEPRATCESCSAPTGGYHHESCREEECPSCGGLLYWCECGEREPGPAPVAPLRRLALAFEWVRIGIEVARLAPDEQVDCLEAVFAGGLRDLPESLARSVRRAPGSATGPHDAELRAREEVVKNEPEDIESWLRLGELNRATGRAERSLRCFDRALALEPDRLEAWLGKAAALNDLARPIDALSACARVLERAPERASGWFERGRSLHALGWLADAVDAFERVTQLEPANADAWKMRGVCQRGVRRLRVELGAVATPGPPRTPALARTAAELVEQHGVSPTAAALAVEAGDALDRGEIALAVDRLRQVNEEAPSLAWAWQARARCAHVSRRFDEAIRCYQTACDLDGRVDDLEGLGSCQRAVGDIDAALETLDRAVALAPELADVWYSRSLALEAAGDTAAALEDFDRFVELASASASGRADRGRRQHADARRRLEANNRTRRRLGR